MKVLKIMAIIALLFCFNVNAETFTFEENGFKTTMEVLVDKNQITPSNKTDCVFKYEKDGVNVSLSWTETAGIPPTAFIADFAGRTVSSDNLSSGIDQYVFAAVFDCFQCNVDLNAYRKHRVKAWNKWCKERGAK